MPSSSAHIQVMELINTSCLCTGSVVSAHGISYQSQRSCFEPDYQHQRLPSGDKLTADLRCKEGYTDSEDDG